MENIFCPKCHKSAAEIKRTEERVELRQKGRTLLSLSTKPSRDRHHPWWIFWRRSQKNVPERKVSRIGVRCPDGHNVQVNL